MTLPEATQKISKMAELHQGKVSAKVNFRFKEEGFIHLDDTLNPALVSNEEAEAPCTVVIGLVHFDQMLSGELNPMMAFMSGKMKIEGDKGIAMKLASLF